MFIDKRSAVAFTILFWSSKSFAFIDPFTIAAGVQVVSGIVGGMKDVDEVADIGISAGELLGEFDVDQSSDDEIKDQIRRLEELSQQGREFRDLSERGKSLFQKDLDKSRSLAQKLKTIREMVKFSKRVASLMAARPKAGERALKVQEIKINYLILDELMAIRQMQFSSVLESKEQKERLQIALSKVLREEGQMNQSTFGRRL